MPICYRKITRSTPCGKEGFMMGNKQTYCCWKFQSLVDSGIVESDRHSVWPEWIFPKFPNYRDNQVVECCPFSSLCELVQPIDK